MRHLFVCFVVCLFVCLLSCLCLSKDIDKNNRVTPNVELQSQPCQVGSLSMLALLEPSSAFQSTLSEGRGKECLSGGCGQGIFVVMLRMGGPSILAGILSVGRAPAR